MQADIPIKIKTEPPSDGRIAAAEAAEQQEWDDNDNEVQEVKQVKKKFYQEENSVEIDGIAVVKHTPRGMLVLFPLSVRLRWVLRFSLNE